VFNHPPSSNPAIVSIAKRKTCARITYRLGRNMQDLLLKIWCSSITRMQEMKDSERGATAVEYGIMVALIAAVIITVVKVVGGKTSNAFESVNSNLP
jgi:pilus assembly protein Flp/PilA